MKNRIHLLSILLLVVASAVSACSASEGAPAPAAKSGSISYVPTPAAIEVLWVDSAGNLGLRGVDSVVQGGADASDPKFANLSESCRKSMASAAKDSLVVCLTPPVGKLLKEKLGWTSGTSAER